LNIPEQVTVGHMQAQIGSSYTGKETTVMLILISPPLFLLLRHRIPSQVRESETETQVQFGKESNGHELSLFCWLNSLNLIRFWP